MRLKKIYISEYKNLNNFSKEFENDISIDIFVGKNGSGKSNFFEATIEIFRHLYEFNKEDNDLKFDYKIEFEKGGVNYIIDWKNGELKVNNKSQRSVNKNLLPDNVLIYYSGHNTTISTLIDTYQSNFSKRIRKSELDESRRFIGIGPDYKGLLLAILLLQSDECKARKYICDALGINNELSTVKVVLKEPVFAKRGLEIDDFEKSTHFWGTEGVTRDFLDQLTSCIKNEFKHSDIYDKVKNTYVFEIERNLFLRNFIKFSVTDQFRLFDNLKTLDMLADISAIVKLSNGKYIDISQYSDGQFQTVYIYAITELFKDRDCITFLDEPDSFLHPEWQFKFLNQVNDVADQLVSKNHVLMSSHSASTISNADEKCINLFQLSDNNVSSTKVKKAEVIQALSAGLISLSESEARLNIQHIIKNTSGPILFTEGVTDQLILETAWEKLYKNEKRKFEIQGTYGSGFLRSHMRSAINYQDNITRKFFFIFDFDEAYNDWNVNWDDVEINPEKCLVKKNPNFNGYAMLLPTPSAGVIRNQVINKDNGQNYGKQSLLTIELLFYGVPELNKNFQVDKTRTDKFIKFVGDKAKFAEEKVVNLDAKHFEVFRPIFEFINSILMP